MGFKLTSRKLLFRPSRLPFTEVKCISVSFLDMRGHVGVEGNNEIIRG